MAATEDLYNTALSALGTKDSVASVADVSVEAEACNRWYPQVRDLVQAAAHWSSCFTIAKLILLRERDTSADWAAADPPPGWIYGYTLPAGYLQARYLSTWGRFQITVNSVGDRWLVTNEPDAILIYTKQVTDITKWDVELRLAVSFALAAHICLKLTGKHERLKILTEQANAKIINARLNDANAVEFNFDTVAPWHAARGVASMSESRYIYPYGPLINVSTF